MPRYHTAFSDKFGGRIPVSTREMKKIGQCRIYADHYQFYIMDSGADPFDGMPEWTEEAVTRGFIANQHVMGVSTRAHLNDHWLELWLSDTAPDSAGFDRAIASEISFPSGLVEIRGLADAPDEVCRVGVTPGLHTVHVLTSNLGVDQFSTDEINQDDDREMTDEEIEQRTDLERYKIVLVPKKSDMEC